MLGAALHAGWNALVKIRLEPLLAVTLVNISAGIIGVPVLLYTGLPAQASWGWAALSLAIHIGYAFALSEAYRRGDMSLVYPIARGGGSLLTALVGVLIVGEHISATGIAGIALLAVGIIGMTLRLGRAPRAPAPAAFGFACLTAVLITCYTLSDGLGARASGYPLAYAALLFVLNGIVPIPLLMLLRGRDVFAPMRSFVLPGFLGGVMGFASYAIAIWAMSIAPIPLVAALRETSVLFGAVIAVAVLKEPLLPNRVIAALVIVAGLVLLRIA